LDGAIGGRTPEAAQQLLVNVCLRLRRLEAHLRERGKAGVLPVLALGRGKTPLGEAREGGLAERGPRTGPAGRAEGRETRPASCAGIGSPPLRWRRSENPSRKLRSSGVIPSLPLEPARPAAPAPARSPSPPALARAAGRRTARCARCPSRARGRERHTRGAAGSG